MPAGARRGDQIADDDVQRGPVREPAGRAEEFPAAPDARWEDRGAGGSGGLEDAEVKGPQPWRGIQCPFWPDHQAAAGGQDSGEVSGAGGSLLRLGPADELAADPGGNAAPLDHVLVENAHSVFPDGPHAQLRLEWHSQLAHHDHI